MDPVTIKAILKKYGAWFTAAASFLTAAAFLINGDTANALNSFYAGLAAVTVNQAVHAQVNAANSPK